MVIAYVGKLFFLKELLKLYLAGGFYSFNVVKVAIVRFFRQKRFLSGAKRSVHVLRGTCLI